MEACCRSPRGGMGKSSSEEAGGGATDGGSKMGVSDSGVSRAVAEDDTALLLAAVGNFRKEAMDQLRKGSNASRIQGQEMSARLLHLACKHDAVRCARLFLEDGHGITACPVDARDQLTRTPLHVATETHSANCVELLLSKNARTDCRLVDGRPLPALQIALRSRRVKVERSAENSIEDLLAYLLEMDLKAMKLLAEKTKEVEVASIYAMEGRVIALAMLLLVAEAKISSPVSVVIDGIGTKRSVYNSVVDEVLSNGDALAREWNERGKALLCEIELLNQFGASWRDPNIDRRSLPPLLRAAKVGDMEVTEMLTMGDVDVNEAGPEGNTAFHWCLSGSTSMQEPRIVWLLLKNGARVFEGNKLRLTSVHSAAAKGNYKALQLLLLHAQDCVDIPSKTKETPLFFAVKNDSVNCVKLLLLCEIQMLNQFGALSWRDHQIYDISLPPLLRAEVADMKVTKMPRMGDVDVNEGDPEGNMTLCWCLNGIASTQEPRIAWLLLKNGARVFQGNKLGLTPVHSAAAKGNYEDFQSILSHAQDCIDISCNTKETLLFFEAESDSVNCAKLLLCFGANPNAQKLQKQRIDMATSQDMRFILNSANVVPWNHGSLQKSHVMRKESHTKLLDDDFYDYESDKSDGSYIMLATSAARQDFWPGNCSSQMAKSMSQSAPKQGPKFPRHNNHWEKHDYTCKILVRSPPSSEGNAFLSALSTSEFGHVDEAIVIGIKTGNKMLSCDLDFVQLQKDKNIMRVKEAPYVYVPGKSVEINDSNLQGLQGDKCGRSNADFKQDGDSTSNGSLLDEITLSTTKLDLVEPGLGGPIQIFIKCWRQAPSSLQVSLDEPFHSVMKMVKDKTGYHHPDDYVSYMNKVVRPDSTLRFYGIGKDSTININTRMRGGQSTFTEFIAQNKKNFTTLVILPDGNLCLKISTFGCQFLSSLVSCFIFTFSKQKSWDGQYSWNTHFKIRNNSARIAKQAIGGLTSNSMGHDLDPLVEFIEETFSSKDKRLQNKFPPYLKSLMSCLKNMNLPVLTPVDKLILETAVCYMEPYDRMTLTIMLKRKYEGLCDDPDKKMWDNVIATLYKDDWPSTLGEVIMIKDVIESARQLGDPYLNTRFSSFRLERDICIHGLRQRNQPHPNAKHGDKKIEIFQDNDGVELMIPCHMGDILHDLVVRLIEAGADIRRELTHALVRTTVTRPFTPVVSVSDSVPDDYIPTWMLNIKPRVTQAGASSSSQPKPRVTQAGASSSSQPKPRGWAILSTGGVASSSEPKG